MSVEELFVVENILSRTDEMQAVIWIMNSITTLRSQLIAHISVSEMVMSEKLGTHRS